VKVALAVVGALVMLIVVVNLAWRWISRRRSLPCPSWLSWGLEGRLCVFQPPSACLRCVFSEGPVKEVFPVIGATPGVIGAMQAMEAIKYLSGSGELLKDRLLCWDGEKGEMRYFRVRKDPGCPDCSNQ